MSGINSKTAHHSKNAVEIKRLSSNGSEANVIGNSSSSQNTVSKNIHAEEVNEEQTARCSSVLLNVPDLSRKQRA